MTSFGSQTHGTLMHEELIARLQEKRGHLMLDELQLQFHLVPTTPLLLSSFVFVVAVLIEAGKRVTGRLQIEARSRLLRILDAKDRAKVRLHRIGRGLRRACKLDPENQLISFQRWVVCPMVISNVHVLDVVGNAYLYNRVWYTTAVLLLIGARLEVPSVVPTLLNSDPDERRIAAHVLSLAVLPEGKKTPLAHLSGLAEHQHVEVTVEEHYLAAAVPLHRPAT
ncbi:hypothetical protein EDB83DRAFT_2680253 [Lactarius deliciosus]|nr:hypothetical protein EDB83DRAFT_2680253 [Lactarius deliciosus]